MTIRPLTVRYGSASKELIVFLAVRMLGSIVFLVFLAIGLAAAMWLLPLFISLGVLGAFLCLCTRLEDDPPTAQLGRDSLRFALGVMACIVVIPYVAIGIATLLGGATMVLTGVIGLAYLGYRSLWRGTARCARQATEDKPASAEFCSMDRDCAGYGGTDSGRTDNGFGETADTVSRRSLPTDPAAVSTDELCRAWRVSYLLLQEARAPSTLVQTVHLRRRYLDEFARRSPEGFRRWLLDDARAADDPSHYIRDQSGRSHGDDTDT